MANNYSSVIGGTTKYFEFLATAYAAIADAGNSGTIKVLRNNTDNSSISIANTKEIILDMDGKTITKTTNSITNAGALTIQGNGVITTNGNISVINATAGTTTISNGTIESTGSAANTIAISGNAIVNVVTGLVSSTNAVAVSTTSSGRVKLGTGGDHSLSTTIPEIRGKTYGVNGDFEM